MEHFRQRVRERVLALKLEGHALYLASRDPRTPWYVKVWVGGLVAYALSPIDLIPDWIPILGYLDDLVILPLGFALAVRMIPQEVLAECRARARASSSGTVSGDAASETAPRP